MIEVILEYGLFLAKTVTLVVAIWAILAVVIALSRKSRAAGHLEVRNLNQKYEGMTQTLKQAMFSKRAFKHFAKTEKTRLKGLKKKDKANPAEARKRMFVLNFHGNIKATAVASLREEISALITLARPEDEVLVRLENPGGLVHEHGLAASQLQRIRQHDIRLTVAVDKVAASGGYMMACVADRILAAPFAVVGSIGVLAQLPNFHRLLDHNGIDFEQMKAGENKRTITMFGENTEEDREKFIEQLEDTHNLFKEFVAEHRPSLNMAEIATGEHWHGRRAIDHNLIDELTTSDDYLYAASGEADLYELTYTPTKSFGEKLATVVHVTVDKLVLSWWQRAQRAYFSA